MMISRLLAGAALAAALLALAGCGDEVRGSPEPGPGGPEQGAPPAVAVEESIVILEYEEMLAEWRERTLTLELPPGVEWPPPPPEPEPAPDAEGILRGTSYEQGIGVSIAEQQWWCAWARHWLEHRGVDEARAEAALTALHEIRDTYHYQQSMDDLTRGHTDGMLTSAGLGDPAPISRHLELNCP